jgi:outer membrane protein assembly factor BamE (lipoprotein component of BamABCDE complex)
LLLSSCQKSDKEFTKELWIEKGEENWLYPQRKFILKDLMDNYLKEGLTYGEIKGLLGEPLNDDEWNHTMRYIIEEEYGWDIDPVKASTLNIYFNSDSIVKGFEVIE